MWKFFFGRFDNFGITYYFLSQLKDTDKEVQDLVHIHNCDQKISQKYEIAKIQIKTQKYKYYELFPI